MIHEVLEFDAAIRTALEFQKRHPDVLVLVTADHETGGLELGNCKESSLAALKPIKNSLEHVSRKIVKDPAGTDNFLEKTGFRLGENEKVFVHKHSQNTQAGSDSEPTGDSKGEPHGVQWLLYALGSIEAERSGVGWSSFGHTAQPVLTRAVGPGENKFSGSYDNTDIAKRMAELLGLPLEQPRERTKEMGSKCAPK